MSEEKKYFVLAYYYFTTIPNPLQEIKAHKAFLKSRDMTCRIYISESGINGQTSGAKEDAEAYMLWMQENPLFKDMPFKIHHYHENVFPRQTVKYKKKLVAIDEEIDLAMAGDHLSPKEWNEMLNQPNRPLLIDVRNDYEWEVGRFDGAECPPCETFREFAEYTENLAAQVVPENTPVMMYCTGGIRCELYSALMKKHGFKQIYQLNGGVINYGLKEGSAHWLGKLFVFDDRLTVPISEEQTPTIGKCFHCGTSSESYYNCASMDCNKLFLCCPECVEKHVGCCSDSCQCSTHLRPYQHQNPHKPFRKWYNYFKQEAVTK